MAIRVEHGNLLLAQVDAIINTVNTVGVAGKGIALQFRQAFPENFRAYEKAAKQGQIVPGKMFVTSTGLIQYPRYIINFPTKRHWRAGSRIADIESGLVDLVAMIREYQISSIAVPPLGCGNGGLDWSDVQPLIVGHLDALSDVDVLLYPPSTAPLAEEMPIRTERPAMTLGRAALLMLLKQYREADSFRLSALEVQKLAYFLQASGESLRLNYVKAKYGPYAENLNHVLRTMDGHYTVGYGDRSREPQIRLVDGAASEAKNFLEGHGATKANLDRVSRLVRGWETPFSLELLATTHWALTHGMGKVSRAEVYKFVASWTPRKADLFKEKQIDLAIDHLVAHRFADPV
ncbi:macro domain-containing protein [Cryptosporangium phraense]|uniref:Macro domain-containing protein n=1 Tax=Cryptosporangium phraense TaxID=2593070 RepID=A0A545AR83_9ACTN|nr:macro domain-containing protein [Cryptosporangium phraense]TQS43751.1 macro domain-containing protein [Cryptosporangium phraense]